MIKFAVLVSALLGMSGAWSTSLPDVIGKAYSFDGKKELYQEKHYYSKDGLNHQVLYLSVEGKQFAKKDLNYKAGKFTPVFKQEDTRYSEIIEVKWLGEQLSISYFAEKDGPKKQKTLDVESPLVIDAGFDRFIRENWRVLVGGKRLNFNFPAPSRLRVVGLVVEKTKCSYATTKEQCFVVNAANWLIKLLFDPIELGYSTDTQRLMRFRGLANIHDENGDGLKVDIRYHYPKNCDAASESNCVSNRVNNALMKMPDNSVATTISLTTLTISNSNLMSANPNSMSMMGHSNSILDKEINPVGQLPHKYQW